MLQSHECPITGEIFVDVKGVISDRDMPIRSFQFKVNGETRDAIAISLKVPVTIGTKNKVRNVDVVCFEPAQIPKLHKMKLKAGSKVQVFARKTDRGLVIDDVNDIEEVKSI